MAYRLCMVASFRRRTTGRRATFGSKFDRTSAEPFQLLCFSGSQTGNGKSVADKVAAELTEAGIAVKRAALKDYKAKTIADENTCS